MIIVQVWGKVNYRIWADEALFDIDEVPEDDNEQAALAFHTLRQSWPHVVHSCLYDYGIYGDKTGSTSERMYSREETEKVMNSDLVKDWKERRKKERVNKNL